MKWETLSDTDDRQIRFCQSCQKEVFFCNTNEELAEAINMNRCICIEKPFLGETTLGTIERE